MVKASLVDVDEDSCVVRKAGDGNRLYNRGCYGKMDGRLNLNLVETCYLLEKGKVEVRKGGKRVNLEKLMEYALKYIPDFEIKYLVYRDLRERGYIVRMEEGNTFLLYERGKRPPAKPAFRVKAISERATFKILEVERDIEEAENKLILGIVDEEGDITYYIAKFFRMRGKVKEGDYEGKIILLNDRCITRDEKLRERLREDFVGREIGDYTQLSLMEAAYLAERGVKITRKGRKMSMERFIKHAREIQPDIEKRLMVYKELRKMRLLPKTGFKFGSHFRVYEGNPERSHAPYLVHVVDEGYETTWAEVSRAVRLAHSVKKEMIFAMVGKGIKYIRLKRITP